MTKPLSRPRTAITSGHNALLKEFRRAARQPKEFCVAEGPRLLGEALRAGVSIRAILLDDAHAPVISDGWPPVPVYRIGHRLFAEVATTQTPQGVAALIRRPACAPEKLFTVTEPLIVLLDGIQDPGNVGTILRTAAALGASGAILLRGTADPFNPKALRASAGAAFHLPLLTALAPKEAVALLHEHRLRLFACVARDGKILAEVNCREAVAMAIGNEAAGLSPEILEASDERVSVPIRGMVESLNAAMAASMALYEVARQRAFRY